MTLKLPAVLEGFPIYSRDSIYFVNSELFDDSKKIRVMINDKDLGFKTPGSITFPVILTYGENKVNFVFTDKANNLTKREVTFNYDPSADITPPIISLNPPFSEFTRGIQVVAKDSFDSLAAISGKFSDQSNIIAIWVNENKVDSIFNDKFYYPFYSSIPDTINLRIADVWGNLITYSAKMQDVSEIVLEADLNQINYHALLITINSYSDPNFNYLDGPIKDGQALAKVLNEYYRFPKSNIKTLKNPTRSQIIKAFDDYRKRLSENDNLLIFYAGHGKYDEDTETGYWLPSDANSENTSNWIANSSVRDYIKGIKTQHTLVISDACFAGSILRGEVFTDAEKSINEIYKIKSRKAIISGSVEAPDKSVFVEYLIQYLKSIERKYFPAQYLFSRLKEPVINNSKTGQDPEYKSIPYTGDEGMSGDFIFARNDKKPEKK